VGAEICIQYLGEKRNMKVKHITAIIGLIIGGIASLHYGHPELAGVCFGAVASWGLVNGAREATKDKGEG